MAVRASKPRYVHSSAVSRCEGETSFNQIQVGGQGGRSEASRWGNRQFVLGRVEDKGAFLANSLARFMTNANAELYTVAKGGASLLEGSQIA